MPQKARNDVDRSLAISLIPEYVARRVDLVTRTPRAGLMGLMADGGYQKEPMKFDLQVWWLGPIGECGLRDEASVMR